MKQNPYKIDTNAIDQLKVRCKIAVATKASSHKNDIFYLKYVAVAMLFIGIAGWLYFGNNSQATQKISMDTFLTQLNQMPTQTLLELTDDVNLYPDDTEYL